MAVTEARITAVVAAVGAVAALLVPAAHADVDDGFSGCEAVPILGLDPKIRKICDGPIYPDGTWPRYRQFVRLSYQRSSCGGIYYEGGCPPWLSNDVTPGWIGGVETYYLTDATIPPGEPGHLVNANRCTETSLRCDPPPG
jgi:hypothetical protein